MWDTLGGGVGGYLFESEFLDFPDKLKEGQECEGQLKDHISSYLQIEHTYIIEDYE